MTKAIGYVRRSTDRQEESLDQQRAQLEAFAHKQGWTLVAVYSDDAISGSELQRPGLDRLLHAAIDTEVEVVLAWDRNRLARPKDALEGLILERRLLDAGKRVVYAVTGQEASRSFTSDLIGLVEHHQNGDYLRKISRDTARGILARVRRGLWPGGPIPFGYDRLIIDHDGTPQRIVRLMTDGSLRVLEPESGTVLDVIAKGRRFKKQDHEYCTLTPSEPARRRALRRIFEGYSVGQPTRRIRDELNATGFRTSFCRLFTVPSINAILENQTYLGRCVYNRRTESKWHRLIDGNSVERTDEGWERRPKSDWIVVDNAWPALISQDLFDQVQARRLDSRRRHRQTTGSSVRSGYLLTGLMYCSVCGGRLTGQTTISGKGYRTRYYVCGSHHRGGKEACPKRYTVPAKVVEEHVLAVIRGDLAKLRDDEQLHRYIADELQRVSSHQSDAQENLQRRLAELDQQSAKLRDHLLALDSETARSMGLYNQAQATTAEKLEVEQKLAECSSCLPKLASKSEIRLKAEAAFDQLETNIARGSLEARKELAATYIHRIDVEPINQQIRISFYPALFTRKIGATGFEPDARA